MRSVTFPCERGVPSADGDCAGSRLEPRPDDREAAGRLRLKMETVERKVFWTVFTVLGLIADFSLPLWWALAATVPIGAVSWWLAYRSDWF